MKEEKITLAVKNGTNRDFKANISTEYGSHDFLRSDLVNVSVMA